MALRDDRNEILRNQNQIPEENFGPYQPEPDFHFSNPVS